MKVSDCPATEVEVRVDARPDEVWSWLLDVDLPARFSTEFQGGGWVEGAEPGLGARFRGRNSHPVAGEWETVSTVTGYEPGRLFAWAVMDVTNPAASWKFELVPDGDGTILRQWAQIGPGPSNLTAIIGSMPSTRTRSSRCGSASCRPTCRRRSKASRRSPKAACAPSEALCPHRT